MSDCCEGHGKCRWAVGSNMPGYMPDSDASHFANYREAVEAHLDDIDRAIDSEAEMDGGDEPDHIVQLEARSKEHADILRKAIKQRKRAHEASFRVGNYVYWLSRM